jgi:hypothetical protein
VKQCGIQWAFIPSRDKTRPQETLKGTRMNRALSVLISAGIAGFGMWITGHTIASGSPLGWTLMGIPPAAVGLVSLNQAIAKATPA